MLGGWMPHFFFYTSTSYNEICLQKQILSLQKLRYFSDFFDTVSIAYNLYSPHRAIFKLSCFAFAQSTHISPPMISLTNNHLSPETPLLSSPQISQKLLFRQILSIIRSVFKVSASRMDCWLQWNVPTTLELAFFCTTVIQNYRFSHRVISTCSFNLI